MIEQKQIAVIGEIPAPVAGILNDKGSLVQAKVYLGLSAGLTLAQIKPMKLTEVRKAAGANAKAIIAEYNTRKIAFHVWSSKVSGLIAADSSLRKSVKVVMSSKGGFLGFDMKSRFVAQSAVGSELVKANARIAELEALVAKALPATV